MAGDVDFRIRLHAVTGNPGSPPSLFSGSPIIAPLKWGETALVDLGATIGQQMLDGTVRGLAISYSGTAQYGALYGPSESALAGQILIDYQRKA